MLLLLSTPGIDFEGGGTRFFPSVLEPSFDAKPSKGSTVVLPSDTLQRGAARKSTREKYCVDLREPLHHRTDAVTGTTSRRWRRSSTPSSRRSYGGRPNLICTQAADDADVGVRLRRAHDEAADSAKSVNTHADRHFCWPALTDWVIFKRRRVGGVWVWIFIASMASGCVFIASAESRRVFLLREVRWRRARLGRS